MAWFENRFNCPVCDAEWRDCWSSTCDSTCPKCGKRSVEPYFSLDLSVMLLPTRSGGFELFISPDTAEHGPDYQSRGSFVLTAGADEAIYRR